MQVALVRDRGQHVEVGARDPRQPEQRQPRGEVEQPRVACGCARTPGRAARPGSGRRSGPAGAARARACQASGPSGLGRPGGPCSAPCPDGARRSDRTGRRCGGPPRTGASGPPGRRVRPRGAVRASTAKVRRGTRRRPRAAARPSVPPPTGRFPGRSRLPPPSLPGSGGRETGTRRSRTRRPGGLWWLRAASRDAGSASAPSRASGPRPRRARTGPRAARAASRPGRRQDGPRVRLCGRDSIRYDRTPRVGSGGGDFRAACDSCNSECRSPTPKRFPRPPWSGFGFSPKTRTPGSARINSRRSGTWSSTAPACCACSGPAGASRPCTSSRPRCCARPAPARR